MSYPKILIVDDEADLRDLLSAELEDQGLSVYIAQNGKEAETMVKTHQSIELVLTDIRMSNGNGLELLDRIIEMKERPIKVILFTGYADIGEEEAKTRGAFALLKKPYSFEALHRVIQMALEN